MKKSLVLFILLALVIVSSSAMAANIIWSVTASPAKTGTFTVFVDAQQVANFAKIVVQPGANINIQNVIPKTGYYLDSVKKDGKVVDKTNLTFVSDTKSHKVVLFFKKNPVITATASPKAGGTITPSGKVSVEYGEDQEFIVAATAGYDVKAIKVDGKAAQLTDNAYTFSNVVKAHTIGVTFAVKSYTITSKVTGGHGKISPLGIKKVNHGKSLTYTAKPDKGYSAEIYIDGVLKKQGNLNKPLTYKYENIAANSTVEAKFIQYNPPISLIEYSPVITIGDISYFICTKVWTGEVYTQTALSQETINGKAAMKVEAVWGNEEANYNYFWNDANHSLFFGFDEFENSEENIYRASPPVELPATMNVGQSVTSTGSWLKNGQNQGTYTIKQTLRQKGSITVPAGTFDDCILLEIDFNVPGQNTSTDYKWYAKGIGEVHITYGDGSVYELTGAKVGSKTYGNVPKFDVADYLPQHVDDTWLYSVSNESGYMYDQTETIGATTTFHGHTVTPLNRTSTNNTDTEYRLLNANGYYAYGNYDPDDEEIYVNPALRLLPKNVISGLTYTSSNNSGWSCSTKVIALNSLTVAAGTFNGVLKVEMSITDSNNEQSELTWWLANDVGTIKQNYGTSELMELKYANINGQIYGTKPDDPDDPPDPPGPPSPPGL